MDFWRFQRKNHVARNIYSQCFSCADADADIAADAHPDSNANLHADADLNADTDFDADANLDRWAGNADDDAVSAHADAHADADAQRCRDQLSMLRGAYRRPQHG